MAALHFLGFVALGLFADVGALDRIVAVVDDEPIFLSELRQRARPILWRVDALGGDPAQRATAKAAALRELVERLVDERLEERDAAKLQISVTPEEVESGIQQVAKQAKMTPAELFTEVKRQGLTEREYRDDIRRQLVEGKLVQLRVLPRVRVTEADARAVYATWVKEQTGPDAPVDLRIVVLRLAPDAEALATQIATQARAGTDFCSLVTKHSQDSTTASACGSRGPVPRSMLMPEIAKATAALRPGEVAAPLLFTDPTGSKAYLVIQRAPGGPATIATFETMKEQMMQRAHTEATERERKLWLKELRKPVFVEVKP